MKFTLTDLTTEPRTQRLRDVPDGVPYRSPRWCKECAPFVKRTITMDGQQMFVRHNPNKPPWILYVLQDSELDEEVILPDSSKLIPASECRVNDLVKWFGKYCMVHYIFEPDKCVTLRQQDGTLHTVVKSTPVEPIQRLEWPKE